MIYRFELTGVTPILFHADDIEMNDELRAWRDDPRNRDAFVPGDDRTPPWTWQTYLYSDGEHLAVPGEVVMAALRHAGAQVKMSGRKTFKSASQSGLCILSEFCEFRGPKGQVAMADLEAFRDEPYPEHTRRAKDFGFKLFAKRARVGQAKHVRVRARFEEWSITGQIKVLNRAITADVLKVLFEIACSDAGFLDWRPNSKQSPGPFGRATAKLSKG